MKNIILIVCGLLIGTGVALFTNNSNIQIENSYILNISLSITVILMMIGLIVLSFILAKPLSKKIEL